MLTTSDRGNRPGHVAKIPGSEAASFPGFGGKKRDPGNEVSTSFQGLLIKQEALKN